MAKRFNYTGTCIPGRHYMVDTSAKIDRIIELVEAGEYFTINRPRQYGKTTTLYLLRERLNCHDDYLVIKLSFEGVGSYSYSKEELFVKSFVSQMRNYSNAVGEAYLVNFFALANEVTNIEELSLLIGELTGGSPKKVVLMIDEVDKSSNNQLFIDFIAMLRDRYLKNIEGLEKSFYSVILAGVHDVKNIKLKLAREEGERYNSPWNIAVDFNVELAFSAADITTMLTDYAAEQEVELDLERISKRLYYYTAGYPFLVSKLCSIIDSTMKNGSEQGKGQWSDKRVDDAVKELLKEDNTNFQSLIKNLENDDELYELIRRIVLEGEAIPLVRSDSLISRAIIYGIIKASGELCKIHNRIYEMLIYQHMTMKVLHEKSFEKASDYNFRDNFILPQGGLNFEKILLKFRQFMSEQYSRSDSPFLERNGRLVFLAFLKPIINGQGFDFKEVQISEEKRLDVVVTYNNFKYVIELKIWRGEEAHRRGVFQLADYLERQNLDKGYLLIFDFREEKIALPEEGWLEESGKKLFTILV